MNQIIECVPNFSEGRDMEMKNGLQAIINSQPYLPLALSDNELVAIVHPPLSHDTQVEEVCNVVFL